VKISVADTGCGIPDQDLSRIFERFYRVDRARSRSVGGTGLGLAIVKHAVELMNGRIEVTSELGKGSTFTLFLPVDISQYLAPPHRILSEP
jgi:two-component system phosphate regulon sensor histidine kinase PhoR